MTGGYPVGTKVKVTCNNGYEQVGGTNIICQISGVWTQSNIECIASRYSIYTKKNPFLKKELGDISPFCGDTDIPVLRLLVLQTFSFRVRARVYFIA